MDVVNPEKKPITDGTLDVLAHLDIEKIMSSLQLTEAEVRRQFRIEEEKEEVVNARIEVAKQKKASTDPELHRKAVDEFYSRMYTFDPMPVSLRTRLMDVYINKGRIGRALRNYVGIPLIAIGVAYFAVTGVRNVAKNARLSALERGVESKVEELYQKRLIISNDIGSISIYLSLRKVPEAAELNEIVTVASSDLEKTKDFFQRYCPNGNAEKNITKENFSNAEKQLKSVSDILGNATASVSKGKEVIELNDGLNAARQSLDSLINEVRSTKPVDVLMNRANTVYEAGIASVEHRQLQQAREYGKQLAEIKTSANEFAVLPQRLEQAYQVLRNVVEHKPTEQWAEKIYVDSKGYIQNVDVTHLKQNIEQLSEMANKLRQEYQIFIVQVSGARTAWPLEWHQEIIDKKGRVIGEKVTNRDYFIRCQARDNGNVVPITFYDVAQQKNVTAKMFGYRISDEKMLGVDDERMLEEFKQIVMSGQAGRTPLAIKKRGYPDEEVVYKSKNTGKVLPFSDKTAMLATD